MLSNYSGSTFEDAGLYGERGLLTVINRNDVRAPGEFDEVLAPVLTRTRTHARRVMRHTTRSRGQRALRPAALPR
jgi:hypothetical protein